MEWGSSAARTWRETDWLDWINFCYGDGIALSAALKLVVVGTSVNAGARIENWLSTTDFIR